MPVTDSIADFITRVRNAGAAKKQELESPGSKIKAAIADILKDQGYIADYEVIEDPIQNKIKIQMRYYRRKPAFRKISRASKPGRRVYVPAGKLPRVKNGLGIAIISTSRGVMTDKAARKQNLGGEVLCEIW